MTWIITSIIWLSISSSRTQSNALKYRVAQKVNCTSLFLYWLSEKIQSIEYLKTDSSVVHDHKAITNKTSYIGTFNFDVFRNQYYQTIWTALYTGATTHSKQSVSILKVTNAGWRYTTIPRQLQINIMTCQNTICC